MRLNLTYPATPQRAAHADNDTANLVKRHTQATHTRPLAKPQRAAHADDTTDLNATHKQHTPDTLRLLRLCVLLRRLFWSPQLLVVLALMQLPVVLLQVIKRLAAPVGFLTALTHRTSCSSNQRMQKDSVGAEGGAEPQSLTLKLFVPALRTIAAMCSCAQPILQFANSLRHQYRPPNH